MERRLNFALSFSASGVFMLDSKSNRVAFVLMQLAYFAFVAHTFDLGCLHRACLHTRACAPSCETGLLNAGFVASPTDDGHSCESDCKLCYDSPTLVKTAPLGLFLFFVLWKVRFSSVWRLLISFRGSCVPLGMTVFLFFESLLI